MILITFFLLSASTPTYADDDTSTNDYKNRYTFTTNWFNQRIPIWRQVLGEFKGKPDIHYLEIGTFQGRSALWILENIVTHPTSKITIIDAFEENTYRTFMSNVSLSGESEKFTTLSGFSTEKLREVPLNSIDFAYIDGSGKGIVMLSDIVSTWNLLKVNGVIIISRYALDDKLRRDLELEPNDPGPIQAIGAFLKVYKPYIKVLVTEDNQVILRKVRQ